MQAAADVQAVLEGQRLSPAKEKALAAAGARQIALAHLSEENNRPEMAMETAEQALEDAGFPPKAGVVRLFVAGQEGPGEPMVSAAGNGYLVVG